MMPTPLGKTLMTLKIEGNPEQLVSVHTLYEDGHATLETMAVADMLRYMAQRATNPTIKAITVY